jgi:hypothetical protein
LGEKRKITHRYWYKKYWAFLGKKEKLPTDTGIRNTGRFGGIKKNYPPILV